MSPPSSRRYVPSKIPVDFQQGTRCYNPEIKPFITTAVRTSSLSTLILIHINEIIFINLRRVRESAVIDNISKTSPLPAEEIPYKNTRVFLELTKLWPRVPTGPETKKDCAGED
jgi:hypothetical protein